VLDHDDDDDEQEQQQEEEQQEQEQQQEEQEEAGIKGGRTDSRERSDCRLRGPAGRVQKSACKILSSKSLLLLPLPLPPAPASQA
jgi:hypothetical protein